MPTLFSGFFLSLLFTFLIIRSERHHGRLSTDHDLSGPQKFHTRAVPRIGGLAIFSAAFLALCAAWATQKQPTAFHWWLIAASLPAFLTGFTEDLTKKVSPRRRLFATAISAALSAWWLNALLTHTAIPPVDFLMQWPLFAWALTIFVVTGVSHSVNLIDGFNGLASMCVVFMLLAVAYVANQVGDTQIVIAALAVVGAILGFFVFNFPAGMVFLGDGGAYFIGFWLAELCVLLIVRNHQISPIFTLLLCAYPIFETIFTIYRRKIVKGAKIGMPDGIHLHTLIYRRWVRSPIRQIPDRRKLNQNSMTSTYLWVMCQVSVCPAILWWDNTLVLTLFLVAFVVLYCYLYYSIVLFKSPKFLVIR